MAEREEGAGPPAAAPLTLPPAPPPLLTLPAPPSAPAAPTADPPPKGGWGMETAILGALVATIAITVAGAALSAEDEMYIGFGTLVCVSLLSTLAQVHSSQKAERSAYIASHQVERAARLATEQAERSAAKIAEVKKVADVTHDLVNSGSLIQLRTLMELSRWKADQLKGQGGPEAEEASKEAQEAGKQYHEHLARQKRVDQAQEGGAGRAR